MYKNHPDNLQLWGKRVAVGAVSMGLLLGQVALPVTQMTTVAFAETNERGLKDSGWTAADIPSIIAFYNDGNGGALTEAGLGGLIELVENAKRLEEIVPGYTTYSFAADILKGAIANKNSVTDTFIERILQRAKDDALKKFKDSVDGTIADLRERATREPEHADAINAVADELATYKDTVSNEDVVNPDKLTAIITEVQGYAGTKLEEKITAAENNGGGTPGATADDSEALAKAAEELEAAVKAFDSFFGKEETYLRPNEIATNEAQTLSRKFEEVYGKIQNSTATVAEVEECTAELKAYVVKWQEFVDGQKVKEKAVALLKEMAEVQALLNDKVDFMVLDDVEKAEEALKNAEAVLQKTNPDPTLDELTTLLDEFLAMSTPLKERTAHIETVEMPALKADIEKLLVEMKDLFKLVDHNFSDKDVEDFWTGYDVLVTALQDGNFSTYTQFILLKEELLETIARLDALPRKNADTPAPTTTTQTPQKRAVPKTGDAATAASLYTLGGASIATLGLLLKKKSEDK